MPGHHDKTPQYGSHQQASGLQESPSNVHLVAQHQGKDEHLTGHEQSRKALQRKRKGQPNKGQPKKTSSKP